MLEQIATTMTGTVRILPMTFVVIGLFVLGGGTVIGLILYGIRQGRLRREALEQFARENGYSYTKTATRETLPWTQSFEVFRRGHSQRFHSVLERRAPDGSIHYYMDYIYVTGHGKHRTTHRIGIAIRYREGLNLPPFLMKPEGFFQKLGATLGMQDIDFEMHPDFSKRYALRAEDEQTIRRLFDQATIQFFELNQDTLYLEANGGYLVVYTPGKFTRPDEIPEVFQRLESLEKLLSRRLEMVGR